MHNNFRQDLTFSCESWKALEQASTGRMWPIYQERINSSGETVTVACCKFTVGAGVDRAADRSKASKAKKALSARVVAGQACLHEQPLYSSAARETRGWGPVRAKDKGSDSLHGFPLCSQVKYCGHEQSIALAWPTAPLLGKWARKASYQMLINWNL
jgi:hypothetical protein